jgi:hypothetical protein
MRFIMINSDLSKEVQQEFSILEFESKILQQIPNKDDRFFLMNFYLRNNKESKYVLKERMREDVLRKILAIFNSIGYISEEKRNKLSSNFKDIESYFYKKNDYFEKYKLVPIEEIINNSPKYYGLIRIIEQINIFLSKDKDWLRKFVVKNNMEFDWVRYEKWKSGKDLPNMTYDDTLCPSKWVHIIQDKFIEILESLQILLYMEFYINEENFKKFLRQNPGIDYKYKANFMKHSFPSENIDKIYEIIDYLLNVNIENSFITKSVIDTTLCMQVYRHIDGTKIFDIIRAKEFYVRFHLEYLRRMPQSSRMVIPLENEILKIADEFVEIVKDLLYTYNEYKGRLIFKYDKIKKKLKV